MSFAIRDGAAAEWRAQAYWFLADLIATAPLPEVLACLMGAAGQVPAEEGGIAAELISALAEERDSSRLAERLAAEHARLFLGLREGYGPPPPYESLWREGCLVGRSTRGVAAAYGETGFEDRSHRGPCDHLATELRFFASLCHAQAESESGGQPGEAHWARERQQAFLTQHLLAWVPDYCRRLIDEAREPFYRALARVTSELLQAEAMPSVVQTDATEGARPQRPARQQVQGGMA